MYVCVCVKLATFWFLFLAFLRRYAKKIKERNSLSK